MSTEDEMALIYIMEGKNTVKYVENGPTNLGGKISFQ